jgi:ABC-type multidrug transport system permease subunit
MRFLFIAVRKDVRRRLADPAALLIWIGIPIVLGGLLGFVTGGGGTPPKAHLLVVDLDQSIISRLLISAGGQPQVSQSLQMDQVNEAEGRKRIDAGEASALLVIPSGFGSAVLREQPTELQLVTNPSQRIMPRMIEEGLRMAVEAAFYAQRLFHEPLQQVTAGAPGGAPLPSDEQVTSISRAFNQRLRVLQDTLLPPVLSLEFKTETAKPAFDFSMLLLPTMLFMSVLFIAQGMSLDIWVEKDKGTLRRVVCSPRHVSVFLAGKVVAGTLLIGMVAVVALAVAATLFHVPPARLPLALLWVCYSGAALFCYFLLIQMLASSQRGGGLLSSLIVMPLMMIGGSFMPFEVMPAWMADVGRWTPNGLAVSRMKDILFGAVDVHAMVIAAAGIGVPAIAVFFLCARRLARGFAVN